MRQFNAAHLEVKKDFTEDFETHPFECGWASEALFFVVVEGVSGEGAKLDCRAQLSHDGVNWADEGSELSGVTSEGVHFLRVKHFGNWLRLACRISGQSPSFRLLIQIALKE